MKIKEAITTGEKLLAPISNEARLETELLLAFVLRQDRIALLTSLDKILAPRQQQKFHELLLQRLQRLPLAYIIGKKEFYGLTFTVTNAVLIPRPETELLVDSVLAWIKQQQMPENGWHIADIGTGSGAIAVSFACHLPDATIFATDVSTRALQIAKKNAQRHHVLGKIHFSKDQLMPLPSGFTLTKNGPKQLQENKNVFGMIDIVVANLPYIPTSHINALTPEVSEHEPRLALDGGIDGFVLYRKLLDQIADLPQKPKLVAFEIDSSQSAIARQAVSKVLNGHKCTIIKDLQGLDRIVMVETRKK